MLTLVLREERGDKSRQQRAEIAFSPYQMDRGELRLLLVCEIGFNLLRMASPGISTLNRRIIAIAGPVTTQSQWGAVR